MSLTMMSAAARALLAEFDAKLAALDIEDQRAMWDVLTALRGPDNSNDPVKMVTTTVIRSKTFPLWMAPRPDAFSELIARVGCYVNPDLNSIPDRRKLQADGHTVEYHFWTHLRAAANRLGIPITE